jgi:hypothetical protein
VASSGLTTVYAFDETFHGIFTKYFQLADFALGGEL